MASCSRLAMEAEGDSTNVPNWLELPRELTAKILQRLGVEDIVMSASQVCPLWWNICKDPLMWRTIDMTNNLLDYPDFELVDICRYAIERSCGLVEDIRIKWFATDDLLKYIAESASHLSIMRLPNCYGISDEGMKEVVKKLSLLEHLDICYTYLSKDSLEAIGRGCLLLKGLKVCINPHPTLEFGIYDDDAFAIAKTMPMLRYLNISGHRLSNEGLLAILDGCPMLEGLSLVECFELDLSGSLEKRCLEQIKEIQLPQKISYYEDHDPFISGLDCENFGFENYFE